VRSQAIAHYEAAISVFPDEMAYYNNLAAVHFEEGAHDQCIATSRKAIEVGRAVRVDYKIVANSYARIGHAYRAMDNFDDAIRAYEDSILEHRTNHVENELTKLRADVSARDKQNCVDPAEAEKARQMGNKFFKSGKFAEAIEKYTEAIRRNPRDHTSYSNRAAGYQKITEWRLALRDVETCLAMDPSFAKGWSRKAGIHAFLKEYHKAMDAYNEMVRLEPSNEEAKLGLDNIVTHVNLQSQSGDFDQARQSRAMQDPGIQAVVGDPQMRSVLYEMQTDPKKAQI